MRPASEQRIESRIFPESRDDDDCALIFEKDRHVEKDLRRPYSERDILFFDAEMFRDQSIDLFVGEIRVGDEAMCILRKR